MNRSTDIAAVHENLKTALFAAFPDVAVSYYTRLFEKTEKAKNLFIHLAEITPADEQTDGADSLEVVMRWELYAVFRFRDPQAKGKLRAFAAQVLAFARGKRFNATEAGNFNAGPFEVVGAYPDEMKPGDPDKADGYEVYRIEFTQAASIRPDDEAAPAPIVEVHAGQSPAIGEPHLGDYQTVFPTP